MKGVMSLLAATVVALSTSAWPASTDLALQQLNHRVFTAREGAPTDIAALAQTPDGTLWIGSPAGLTRFDGIRFTPYPGASEEPLPSTNIQSLFASPDGSLWIGYRPGGISVIKEGRVTHYDESDGLPDGTVAQFALDDDGSMWAAPRLGLAHLKGKRWEKVADEPQLNTPYGVLVDRSGTLWVATVDGLLARSAGETRFRVMDSRRYADPAGHVLAESLDGKVWAASAGKLLRIDQSRNSDRTNILAVRGISGGPLLSDEEGNVWASDADARSLLRMPFRDLPGEGQQEVTAHPETFSRAEGWNSGRVSAFLEDSERNVWVGTNTALHRFSHTNVVRDALPPCTQGSFNAAPFAAGDAGSLWMACVDGGATGVYAIRDGAIASRQDTPAFNVASRDHDGTVWFAGPTALGHIEGTRLITTPLPPQLRGRPIQALVRDDSGAIWVSASRRGIFRLHDNVWSAYGNLDALPRGYALAATADGVNLWFGFANNRVARVSGPEVQLFGTAEGLGVGNVLAILAKNGEVWIGGELGLARFDGTRFVSIRSASVPFKAISGIVRARNGDLWLNGVSGIARIAQHEIERVMRDPALSLQHETFDYLDGVPGTAVQLRPQPSAIEGTDGRIWFTMTAGVIAIDATRLVRNTRPPPVTIWSLTSGSRRYPNRGALLQLPVHTSNLQIDYSAGSLTVPERVRFRYKLEGSDDAWQDVGARREALYTNLGPGRYTFRVIASNNDGVWNNTGASIRFSIPPAFHQTGYFLALCGLACAVTLLALYRVRMRQLAAQVRSRLEARLAERERIARELHDTLLQGMQGLIWRFQAATDRIPANEPARKMLEQSLDRADALLGESRDRVKDLRPAARDIADLAQALATEGDQFAQLHPAVFRVSVQGTRRELHPLVREEGFLIGREALSNAFQHASAAVIEAEITYEDAMLHVRIRDDGQGISGSVLDAAGKPGHFGLVGMRERAKKLGARIDVWSKRGGGTEVELRVPARVAYKPATTVPHGRRIWRTLFGESR